MNDLRNLFHRKYSRSFTTMANRLKRRSSIGLASRRDSLGDPQIPEPFTQATEDEEAERRARNLQRKHAQNMETGQDSPGLER